MQAQVLDVSFVNDTGRTHHNASIVVQAVWKTKNASARARVHSRCPRVTKTMQRAMEAKHGSPRKSTNERQLWVNLPETRIWRVFRKRLPLNLYQLQSVVALKSKTKCMTYELSSDFQVKLEKADMAARPVAAMKQHITETATTFGAWGSQNPHQLIQQEWITKWWMFLCHFTPQKIQLSLLCKNIIQWNIYGHILIN